MTPKACENHSKLSIDGINGTAAGSQVTLHADANRGSRFVGWTGACTGSGSCSISTQLPGQVIFVFPIFERNSASFENWIHNFVFVDRESTLRCASAISHPAHESRTPARCGRKCQRRVVANPTQT